MRYYYVFFLFFLAIYTHAIFADDRVIKENDFAPIMRELMIVQEKFLSATIPRPYGNAVTNNSDEIIRRMGIVIDTWEDYQRGIADAKSDIDKGKLYLKGNMPLNQIEKEYIKTLSTKYKCRFKQVSSSLTNYNDIAYVYGYNTMVGKYLISKNDKYCFGHDIGRAVRKICGEDYDFAYFSAFFIPLRFTMPMENITVRTRKADIMKQRHHPIRKN